MTHDEEIRLRREGDRWVAEDVGTGVTAQRPSRAEALSNRDEAVALYDGEIARGPTGEELHELGIDPARNGDR